MRRTSWSQLILVTALALSILANVFLLGFVARNMGAGPEAGVLAESIGAAYPAEVRTEFRHLLRENRPRTVAALRDLRQARQGLTTAMNKATFDEAAVERAMQNVRTATEALQSLMQEFLLEALKRRRETD